jgi:hypothetical protein
MKNIILSLVVVLSGLIVGCATFPKDDIEVDTEANPKINFSGYKSYQWLATANVLNDPDGEWNPPDFDADAEIQYLINGLLRKRGMSEVSMDPDMFVAYAAGVDMDAIEAKLDKKTNMTTLENVPSGALVVMLIDAQTATTAWVGVATGNVKNEKPAVAKKRLEYAIKTMFDNMPK